MSGGNIGSEGTSDSTGQTIHTKSDDDSWQEFDQAPQQDETDSFDDFEFEKTAANKPTKSGNPTNISNNDTVFGGFVGPDTGSGTGNVSFDSDFGDFVGPGTSDNTGNDDFGDFVGPGAGGNTGNDDFGTGFGDFQGPGTTGDNGSTSREIDFKLAFSEVKQAPNLEQMQRNTDVAFGEFKKTWTSAMMDKLYSKSELSMDEYESLSRTYDEIKAKVEKKNPTEDLGKLIKTMQQKAALLKTLQASGAWQKEIAIVRSSAKPTSSGEVVQETSDRGTVTETPSDEVAKETPSGESIEGKSSGEALHEKYDGESDDEGSDGETGKKKQDVEDVWSEQELLKVKEFCDNKIEALADDKAAQSAFLVAAIKTRFGIDNLLGDFGAKSLLRLYELLDLLPSGHTTFNKNLKTVDRSKELGTSTYDLKTTITIMAGDLKNTKKYETSTGDLEVNTFDATTYHEIGHSVDHATNYMETKGGGKDHGEWKQVKIEDIVAVGAKSLKQALKQVNSDVVKDLENISDNEIERLVGAYIDSGKTDYGVCIKYKGLENVLEQDGTVEWCRKTLKWSQMSSSYPSKSEAAELSPDGKVSYKNDRGVWWQYSLAARDTQVSNYQFNARAEWFAEVYTLFMLGKLPEGHPCYDDIKAMDARFQTK
jgi:hypothetical protein